MVSGTSGGDGTAVIDEEPAPLKGLKKYKDSSE